MGKLSQSFPTKRGREKYLRSLWDENGNSKGWVEYPPDPRDLPEHTSKGRNAKRHAYKRAKMAQSDQTVDL